MKERPTLSLTYLSPTRHSGWGPCLVHGPLPCAHLLNMAQESHLFGLIGLKTIQELFIQLPHGLKKLGVLASGQGEPPATNQESKDP